MGDTADGSQPHSYTKGKDVWHQPKTLPRALPEALLPKARPAIGDLVLLPASHKFAPGGIGEKRPHLLLLLLLLLLLSSRCECR